MLLVVTLPGSVWGIHPCIFTGGCVIHLGPQGIKEDFIQNNQNQKQEGRESDNVNSGIDLGNGWVRPENLPGNHIYYFADEVGHMTWDEADNFCLKKGAYLAEPLTQAENDFLKFQARSHSNTNWWIGLRETEDCKCRGTDGRSTVQFDASIDYTSVGSNTG